MFRTPLTCVYLQSSDSESSYGNHDSRYNTGAKILTPVRQDG